MGILSVKSRNYINVVLEKITITNVCCTCGKGLAYALRKDLSNQWLMMKKDCCLEVWFEKVIVGVQVPVK